MVSLSILIDASGAKRGADEFNAAARSMSQSSALASNKVKELEKATGDLARAESAARSSTRDTVSEQARASRAREETVSLVRRHGQEETNAARVIRQATDFEREQYRLLYEDVAKLTDAQRARASTPRSAVALPSFGGGTSQLSELAGEGAAADSVLAGLGGTAVLTGAAIAGIGAAAAGTIGFLASSIRESLDYEASLGRLNSLLRDNAEFEQRRKKLLAESNRTGIEVAELSAAEEAIQRAFKDSGRVEEIRPILLNLANTAKESAADRAAPFARIVEGFDLSADEAQAAANRIFADAKRSGSSVTTFATTLSSLVSEAKDARIGFNQLSPALAGIADETDNLGAARATVARLFNVIIEDGDTARKKLDEIGGVNFGELPNKTRDLVSILREMRSATQGARPDAVANIFSQRDTPSMIAALSTGLSSIEDAERNAAKAAEDFNRKLADQEGLGSAYVGRLSNRFANLKKEIGASFDLDKGVGGFLESLALRKTDLVGLEQLSGFVDDLIGGAPQAATELGKLPPEVQKLFDTADKLREIDRGLAALRPPQNLVEEPTADAQKLIAARESLIDAINRAKPTPLTFEAALSLEPGSVQTAFARIGQELKKPLGSIDFSDVSYFAGALTEVERATQRNVTAAKGLDAARAAEAKRTDDARKALEEYLEALRLETREAGLSDRERAARSAQRKGEDLARAALRTDYVEIGRIFADLTIKSRDLAQIERNRLEEDAQKARDLAKALADLERYGPFIPEPEPFQPPAPPASEDFGPFQTDDQLRANQRLGELSRSVQQERSLLGLSNEERERAIYLREVEANAIAAGVTNVDALVAAYDAEFRAYQNARRLDELGGNLGRGLADGFEDALFNAKSLDEAINDIGRSLSRIAYNALVTQPLTDFLSGAFRGGLGALFGGGAGGGGGGPIFGDGGAFDRGRVVAYARGGAFSGGRELERFAYGDVFDSPTYFGMAGGRRGVLGEAGPEAIVPLAKMPNGKLGVQSAGEPAPAPTVVQHTTHVTMHVHAKDANSFRSSERQIVSDLKRKTRGR